MVFGGGGLQVERNGLISPAGPDSLKLIKTIDPTSYKYSIEDLCILCKSLIERTDSTDTSQLLRSNASDILLAGLEHRLKLISSDQFFSSLKFIQFLCPFETMSTLQKKRLMGCCFMFAKETGPIPSFREQLWKDFVAIYGPDSEIETVREAASLFMANCIDYLVEKRPEANECIEAMEMCLEFLNKAWKLTVLNNEDSSIVDNDYRSLGQDFIINALSVVRTENFIPILDRYILTNPEWIWTPQNKSQFFVKFKQTNLDIDLILKLTTNHLRFRSITENGDHCEILSWFVVRSLAKLNRLSHSYTHKTLNCLIQMPTTAQRFVRSECESEFRLYFSKFSKIEIKDIPALDWSYYGISSNVVKNWTACLEKLGTFFSAFVESSDIEMNEGIQNYMIGIVLNGVEDGYITDPEDVLRGIQILGNTLENFPAREGSRKNVIMLSSYLTGKLDLEEEPRRKFLHAYAINSKMDLTWESEIVYATVDLSDISKESADELVRILEDWSEMIFVGEQDKRKKYPSQLKLFPAESIMRSMFIQVAERGLLPEDASFKEVPIVFYKYALATFEGKKICISETDFERLLSGLRDVDLSNEDSIELYKLAKTNLELSVKDQNQLVIALLDKFCATHDLYKEEDFNFICNELLDDPRLTSRDSTERGLYNIFLRSLNQKMEILLTKVFLMPDTLDLFVLPKTDYEIGPHMKKLERLAQLIKNNKTKEQINACRNEIGHLEVIYDFNEHFITNARNKLRYWDQLIGPSEPKGDLQHTVQGGLNKLANVDLEQRFYLNWIKIYHLEIKRLISIFGQKQWRVSHGENPQPLSPSLRRILKLNQSQSDAKALIILLEYTIKFLAERLIAQNTEIHAEAQTAASEVSKDIKKFFSSTNHNFNSYVNHYFE